MHQKPLLLRKSLSDFYRTTLLHLSTFDCSRLTLSTPRPVNEMCLQVCISFFSFLLPSCWRFTCLVVVGIVSALFGGTVQHKTAQPDEKQQALAGLRRREEEDR